MGVCVYLHGWCCACGGGACARVYDACGGPRLVLEILGEAWSLNETQRAHIRLVFPTWGSPVSAFLDWVLNIQTPLLTLAWQAL